MGKGNGIYKYLVGKESFPEWHHSSILYLFLLTLHPKVPVKKTWTPQVLGQAQRWVVGQTGLPFWVLSPECGSTNSRAHIIFCLVPIFTISLWEYHVRLFQKPPAIFRDTLLILNSALSLVPLFLSSETRIDREAVLNMTGRIWVSLTFENAQIWWHPDPLVGIWWPHHWRMVKEVNFSTRFKPCHCEQWLHTDTTVLNMPFWLGQSVNTFSS